MLLLSHVHEDNWSKAFTHSEVNPDFFVHRPKELDEKLPWDFIDHGIYKEHSSRSTSSLSRERSPTSAMWGIASAAACADPHSHGSLSIRISQHSRYFSAEVWALSLPAGNPQNGVKHETSRSTSAAP